MNVMLFLGSGTSYASGLPSVGEITRSLLQDEWMRHTNGVFYPASIGPGRLNDPTRTLQQFLGLLVPHANRSHVIDGRAANYEDLFFLVEQIAEDHLGWGDNPAIHPFIAELKKETEPLTMEMHQTLGKMAHLACDFIRCVVSHCLRKVQTVRGLDLIEALARTESVVRLDIVTLNHDLLIERFLQERGVSFVDGFGIPVDDVRCFDPSLFDSATKVRIFKLHGSINWYRFRSENENPFSDQYGIPAHGDADHCRDKTGRFLDNVDMVPWILAGTNNKAARYGFGIYASMHYWFHKLLNEHDTIAMSGYGWGDRGINGRLMDWLHSPGKRRLVLMHEKPDDLAQFSRSKLWHRYQPLAQAGRIVPLLKWMQDASLNDLFGKLSV